MDSEDLYTDIGNDVELFLNLKDRVKKTCMVQWGENTMCSSLDEYDKCNNTQFVSYCKDKKGNILGTNRYSCKAQALMGPTCVPVKPN